jgi:hypothetical protein
MLDNLNLKIRARVERRLSKPRWVILNALLFTLFTVIIGTFSALTHPYGAMNGVVYFVIFFWTLVLLAHAGLTYWNSGARHGRREKLVQEEVLDAGETYDLSEEEMIDLHQRVSEDLRARSTTFNRLLLNAAGNVAAWPGMMLILLAIQQTINVSYGLSEISDYGAVVRVGMLLSLAGTFALGFLLPVRQLLGSRQSDHMNDLRAIYGGRERKTKREAAESRLVGIDDEGELIVDYAEVSIKQKRE